MCQLSLFISLFLQETKENSEVEKEKEKKEDNEKKVEEEKSEVKVEDKDEVMEIDPPDVKKGITYILYACMYGVREQRKHNEK